jgi:serine/threonine protein kinase
LTGSATPSSPPTVRQTIDAFVAGALTAEALPQALQARMQAAPDDEWEILSLADQYYRRGKLSADAYSRIKSCVGAGRRAAQSAPGLEVPTLTPAAAVKPPAPGADAPAGVLRDRYVLTRKVGRGDSATVFAARDTYLVGTHVDGEPVAVKLLDAELTAVPGTMDRALAAFERLRSLSHPNIIRVHDVDRDGGRTFFTMELLVGSRLGDALEANPARFQNTAYALRLIQTAGSAIAYAHSRGLVHGKLDAHHIYLCDDGGLRVLGFCGEPAEAGTTSRHPSRAAREGRPADERDDVFALAAIAYRLLSGRFPYGATGVADAQPPGATLERPTGITESQWAALRAGLAIDRFARPADVSGWLRALETPGPPSEAPAPPAPPTTAIAPRTWRGLGRNGLIVAGALLLLVGAWQRITRSSGPPADAPGQLIASVPPVKPTVKPPVAALEPTVGDPPAATERTVVERPVAESVTVAPATPAANPAPEWATNVRIEFQTSDIDLAPNQAVATLVVRRRGSTRGKAGFTWWTESGTAKPGSDFENVNRRSELIEDGKSTVSLLIPVILRAPRPEPSSFYVFIDDPSPGALIGAKAVAIVTIAGTNPP